MKLHTLSPNPGSKHRVKRLGCGESSGHGKTSGGAGELDAIGPAAGRDGGEAGGQRAVSTAGHGDGH